MTDDFDTLVEEAREGEAVFGRGITCDIHRVNGGILSVSRLKDRFHDITLSILIDPVSLTITEARVEMDKVPYEICEETARGIDNIKGIFVLHPAVNREVRRAIKRREGCTHLFELIEFTLQTLFTGGPRAGLNGDQLRKIDSELLPEEHRRLQMTNPRLRNTCKAFVPDE